MSSMSHHHMLQAYADGMAPLSARWNLAFPDMVSALHQIQGHYVFVGLGKTGLTAQRLAATWRGLGLPAHFMHATEAFHGDLGGLQPNDGLILLSKSGNGSELLGIAQWATQRHLALFGLLGNDNAPLRSFCKHTLDCSVTREADDLNLAPSVSLMVTQMAGEMLGFSLAQARGFSQETFKNFHPAGQLGRNLSLHVQDVMQSPAQVGPTTPMREVLLSMTEKNLGAACVVQQGVLLGIITEGDIRRWLLAHGSLDAHRAEEVMHKSPTTISPEATLAQALETMENRPNKLLVLPVVHPNQQLLGLIRLHDIYG